MIIRTLAAAAALSACAAPGAVSQQPRPVACESEAVYDDFDFWVGEWNVYDPQGEYAGLNSITKVNGGCLILEHWTGASGQTGDSMNFYDPMEEAWRQVWVSRGFTIDYTGGLNADGEMVLDGRIAYHLTEPPEDFQQEADFRGTWTLLEDGTVRQHFEQKNAEGEWTDWFIGIYVRVEDDPRAEEAAAIRAGSAED